MWHCNMATEIGRLKAEINAHKRPPMSAYGKMLFDFGADMARVTPLRFAPLRFAAGLPLRDETEAGVLDRLNEAIDILFSKEE